MKLQSPALAPLRSLRDVDGKPVELVAADANTLLCFFRDAACPFCNLRVYVLANRYVELRRRGLRIVAVFASSTEEIRRFVLHSPKPFPVVADPTGELYKLYGIERSFARKLRAILTRLPDLLRGLRIVGLAGLNTNNLVPADFLINRKGEIVEAYYGRDAGDHIPLERLQALASL